MLAVLTLIALAVSPVVAVLVSMWIQDRNERRRAKLILFSNLMATRHAPVTDENVRALNMIDVLFHDKPTVRKLWREYIDMLSNEGLNNTPEGWKTRQTKNLELLQEMAKVLGYGKAITHLDVDRVYYPQGLVQQGTTAQEIAAELLRVLKSTAQVNVAVRDQQPARAGERAPGPAPEKAPTPPAS